MRAQQIIALACALVVMGAGTACSAPERAEPRPPTHHRIEMRALAFVPEQVKVRPGDTITWLNRDIVPHTATIPGVVDSGELGAGKDYTVVVEWDSTAHVSCAYHPVMRGELVTRSTAP